MTYVYLPALIQFIAIPESFNIPDHNIPEHRQHS